MIIVTPVIVNPTSGRSVRAPTDGYVPPNDFERILLGRFQGSPKQAQVQQPPRQPPARRPVRLRLRVSAMRALPSRAFAAALAALAVAGCEAQPVGYFDRAAFRADQAVQPYTFYFQPDSDALAVGERERLASYLRTLAPRPGHDLLVEVGKSGSPVLDGRRVLALRRVFAGSPGARPGDRAARGPRAPRTSRTRSGSAWCATT